MVLLYAEAWRVLLIHIFIVTPSGELTPHYSSLRLFLIGFTLIVPASPLQAQEKRSEKAVDRPADHIMHLSTNLTWTDGPASLPKGIKSTVLEGGSDENRFVHNAD